MSSNPQSAIGPQLDSLVLVKQPAAVRSQQLLSLACKALGARWAGICLFSNENELVEHHTHGLTPGQSARLWRESWTKDIAQFVIQRNELINCEDLNPAHPSLGQPPDICPIGPFLALPLHCLGRCRGVIYFARAKDAPAFTRQDEETILPLGDWFEEGKLLDETSLLAQLRLLNQIAQVTAGSLDLGHIVGVTLRELDRHLPLHVSAVWLAVDGEPVGGAPAGNAGASASAPANSQSAVSLRLTEFDAAFGEQAARLGLEGGELLPLDETPFAPCLSAGTALYADLARNEERRDPLSQRLALRGANASFAVPLRSGEQTLGILQSICTRPTGFTNAQIQLVYLVADLLGPAISHCRLFGRLRSAYEKLRDTHRQLIQAEKLRALGELASGMAHDFNNSLCGVLGFLELGLVDQNLTPALKQNLESARTCALDAAQTVTRVQEFARRQRNELSIHFLDLNELVRQTVQLTRHKWEGIAPPRGTPIAVDLQLEATAYVSGSAAEFREVLTNLIFNAVDAMPEGGRLTVRTWSSDSQTHLSVSDTGTGMSESVRKRLFEPFFTTKGERGNGLGLSVTFGIVQRYGGDISVESQLGRGSTFVIRLPAVMGSATSSHPQTTAAPALSPAETAPEAAATTRVSAPAVPASKGLRVLVIEDEETIRRFLKNALSRLGHRPRITVDADEGLSAFREERFDVVMTDFGLPGMNGEEVARAVHRASPQTPVILLTGWSSQLTAEGHPLEGVTQIIGKPVTLQVLAKTLETVS
jgi:signal transduction histidine kinase